MHKGMYPEQKCPRGVVMRGMRTCWGVRQYASSMRIGDGGVEERGLAGALEHALNDMNRLQSNFRYHGHALNEIELPPPPSIIVCIGVRLLWHLARAQNRHQNGAV